MVARRRERTRTMLMGSGGKMNGLVRDAEAVAVLL